MKKTILVAGATGSLGEKICSELLKLDVNVKAIVRPQSDPEKIKKLHDLGVETVTVHFDDQKALEDACRNVSCVVSALAGLEETIVDAQTKLLDAAVNAGVPRFIPSDFCIDYTDLPEGANRNFDLRKKFTAVAQQRKIKLTSVFNGAFSYVLQYGLPLFNTKEKKISYYEGKQDWKIDFTSIENTSAFTAKAATDDEAPRYLHIAGFRVSADDLVQISEKISGKPFELKNEGNLEDFKHFIQKMREGNPEGEHELYPAWQQMQYLYCMFAAQHEKLDSDRYSGINWQTAEDVIAAM